MIRNLCQVLFLHYMHFFVKKSIDIVKLCYFLPEIGMEPRFALLKSPSRPPVYPPKVSL